MAQGWWSVAGLTADIVGFSILAIDVGREYARHRRAQSLEESAAAAEWLVRDREREAERKERGEGEEPTRVRRELRDLNRGMREAEVRISELVAQYEGEPKLAGSMEEKAAAFREMAKAAGSRPFKRAPIFTGVFLVLIGFVLQVAGSIPCG
jgi:hypothetical protein